MPKITRQTVQELAADIVELCIHADTEEIKQKAKELLEQVIILNYKATSTPKEATTDTVTIDTEATETKETKLVPDVGSPEVSDDFQSDTIDEPIDFQQTLDFDDDTGLPEEKPTRELPKIDIADEFKDTINADVAAELFERAEKIQSTKKSLNDSLSQNQIQIGLNDRIAFVKHLFYGNVEDFNRVLSQLNSFTNKGDALNFIDQYIQPDYKWDVNNEVVKRFMKLVESKFL